MKLTRIQFAHQPSVRELQGMLRAKEPAKEGIAPTCRTLEALPGGVLVELLDGARWWVTPTGWAEVPPGEAVPGMAVAAPAKGK